MKLQALILGISAGLFATGCVTSQLLDEKPILHRPSLRPELSLFANEQGQVLVEYTEWYAKRGRTRRRAYWLDPARVSLKNAQIVGERPNFVPLGSRDGLRPILILREGERPASMPLVYAACSDSAGLFSINVSGERHGPYQLPIYKSPANEFLRMARVPLAVALDGGVAAGTGVVVAGALVQPVAAIVAVGAAFSQPRSFP